MASTANSMKPQETFIELLMSCTLPRPLQSFYFSKDIEQQHLIASISFSLKMVYLIIIGRAVASNQSFAMCC